MTKTYTARKLPAPVQAKDKKTDLRAVIVKRTFGQAKILQRSAGAETVICTMDEAVQQQETLAALMDDVHAKTQLFRDSNQKVIGHPTHDDVLDFMQGYSFEDFCTVVKRAADVARGFYNKITAESANAATPQAQLDEDLKANEKYQQLCDRLRTERGEWHTERADLRKDKVDYRTERDAARKDRDRCEEEMNVLRNEMEQACRERDGYLEALKESENAKTRVITQDSVARAAVEEKLKLAEAENLVLEEKIKHLVEDHKQKMTMVEEKFDTKAQGINRNTKLRWHKAMAKQRELQLGVEENLKTSEAARSGLEEKIKSMEEKHARELKQMDKQSTSKEKECRRNLDKAERAQKAAIAKLGVLRKESTKQLEDLKKDHEDEIKILTDGYAWDLAKEKAKIASREKEKARTVEESATDERKVLDEEWNKRLEETTTAQALTIKALNERHAQDLAREISISNSKDQQIKTLEGDVHREVVSRKAQHCELQKKEHAVASQANVISSMALQNMVQKHEVQRLQRIKSRIDSQLSETSNELLAQRCEISLKDERICTLEKQESELNSLLRSQRQEMTSHLSNVVVSMDKNVQELEAAKSNVDLQLEHHVNIVAAQLETISSKDLIINELRSVNSRLTADLEAESTLVSAKSKTISSKDEEIQKLKGDKIIDETSLDQKINALAVKERTISQHSLRIDTLMMEQVEQRRKGLESLEALQLELNNAVQRANNLSDDFEQAKMDAAAEKGTLEIIAKLANEKADNLAFDLKARNRTLRQKECGLTLKTQRIKELHRLCTQKEGEASVERAKLEELIGFKEASDRLLQGKIEELAEAQLQDSMVRTILLKRLLRYEPK